MLIKGVVSDFGLSYGSCSRQIVSGNMTRCCHHRICTTETAATERLVGEETDPGHAGWIPLGMARRGMRMKGMESQLVCQLGFTTPNNHSCHSEAKPGETQ